MIVKTIANLSATAACFGLAFAPLAAQAQDADGAAAGNPLGISEDVTMMGTVDPNVRKATAVVNGAVITDTDVAHRLALLLAANEQQLSPDQEQRVRMQVLRNLIDETLQIQAAEAQEMAVDRAEIDRSYSRLAAQNFEQRPEAMDEYLLSIGSSPVSLKRQIEGELAWQRLLQRNISPLVNVSAEEVNELIERLEAAKGTNEFWLWEIFLSSTPESRETVEANAARIMEQLREGGSFVAYARQFSEASTAAVGGDLGWIQLPQLKSPQLETVVGQMEPGQLFGPIEIPGGYSIVYLREKRQVLMADPRDAVLSLKQIQIGFEPGMSQDAANARLQAFREGVQTMRGCGDADRVAAQLGASVVDNDQIRARALPAQLQEVILNLQVGQATPPFGGAEEGVRVLMLCGRDDPEVEAGPDFDKLMAQLEEERVGKRAQRYLRDLRNDAFIEYN